jgi:hypothetical protein
MKKQNHKKQAAPEFTTDADGQQLVHVALANSSLRATLYADDYRRLTDAGFSRHWQHAKDGRGNAYATLSAYSPEGVDGLVPVARLIIQAEAGKSVRYADGNPLNLRTENLKLMKGTARYSAADWCPNATALLNAGRPLKSSAWREGSRPPRKTDSTPTRPSEAQQTPTAATEPRQSFTPRVVDVAALGQRVRQQMAAKAAEVTA